MAARVGIKRGIFVLEKEKALVFDMMKMPT
jgi:hypothetical protein